MRRTTTVVVIASVVGALVATPIAVYASHSFIDVPDSNTFHEDIAWLADAGVTKGCNPPANNEYCPEDEVTREQMAAFMRRLAENQVVDAGTLAGLQAGETGTRAEVAYGSPIGNFDLYWGPTVTLTLPSPGVVIAVGEVRVSNSVSSVEGTCWLGKDFEYQGWGLAEDFFFLNPDLPVDNCRAMGAVIMPAGTHEIQFRMECAAGGDDSSCLDTYADRPIVWATWAPFDGEGNTPTP